MKKEIFIYDKKKVFCFWCELLQNCKKIAIKTIYKSRNELKKKNKLKRNINFT